MIQPALKHDALLADIAAARNDTYNMMYLWWLGQSGFLMQYQNRHLLLDPYLSDSLTNKYADTDKPHVRMTERCIDPQRLDFINVVTSSHNHTDHLDADTLIPLINTNPSMKIIIPEANREFVANRLNIDLDTPIGLADAQSTTVAGFEFHGIPAAHDELATDEHGNHKFMGYVVKFGPWCIYHSGDTLLYDGLEERLRKFDIDLAFLPINGKLPERRVAGNLWGREAAKLAHDVGVTAVFPCHYDMFTFNTETTDEFVSECERLGQDYRVLQCGERWPLGLLSDLEIPRQGETP